MSILAEKLTPGDVFKFEDGPEALFSRDNILVISGQNLLIGTVVSKITASGKVTILAPAAVDGSQTPVGIMFSNTDATAGDTKGVMVARDAIYADVKAIWPGGISGPQKTAAIAALASLGIIPRVGV